MGYRVIWKLIIILIFIFWLAGSSSFFVLHLLQKRLFVDKWLRFHGLDVLQPLSQVKQVITNSFRALKGIH